MEREKEIILKTRIEDGVVGWGRMGKLELLSFLFHLCLKTGRTPIDWAIVLNDHAVVEVME